MNEALDEFFEEIRSRMKMGHEEYGDRSFSKEPAELIRELEEEILDICGWAFILRARMRRIKAACAELQRSE